MFHTFKSEYNLFMLSVWTSVDVCTSSHANMLSSVRIREMFSVRCTLNNGTRCVWFLRWATYTQKIRIHTTLYMILAAKLSWKCRERNISRTILKIRRFLTTKRWWWLNSALIWWCHQRGEMVHDGQLRLKLRVQVIEHATAARHEVEWKYIHILYICMCWSYEK